MSDYKGPYHGQEVVGATVMGIGVVVAGGFVLVHMVHLCAFNTALIGAVAALLVGGGIGGLISTTFRL